MFLIILPSSFFSIFIASRFSTFSILSNTFFVFDLKKVKTKNDSDFEIEVRKLISEDAYYKHKNPKYQMPRQTNDDEYKILKYIDMPIIEFNKKKKTI